MEGNFIVSTDNNQDMWGGNWRNLMGLFNNSYKFFETNRVYVAQYGTILFTIDHGEIIITQE